MVFSSTFFLFSFLPIVLFLYFISKDSIKNSILLCASLFFYAWGEPKHIIIMFLVIILNYFAGILLTHKRSKLILILAILGNLSFLFIFKYTDFFINNINYIFDTNLKNVNLVLPIGISFFTFQSMSYTIDVYRGEVSVQRNLLKLALYVSLFPQLVAGPIVRYQTVEYEINNRVHTIEKIKSGIIRFIYGLSKKVLIANFLGTLSEEAFSKGVNNSILLTWIAVIAYSLQIYFDFSGYSDMAIGLGKIFGFSFLENFNYPYISTSASEFWRRWHISLGSWFKDYVYIPLGGNKKGKLCTYKNLFVVWFLTGFWHGANWTFILWGLLFFLAICIEKSLIGDYIRKLWKPFQHLYLLLLIMIGWVLFRANSLSEAGNILKTMFGFGIYPYWHYTIPMYLNDYWYILVLGILFSLPTAQFIKDKLTTKLTNIESSPIFNVCQTIILMFLFSLVVLTLINSTYNPFLYFNF